MSNFASLLLNSSCCAVSQQLYCQAPNTRMVRTRRYASALIAEGSILAASQLNACKANHQSFDSYRGDPSIFSQRLGALLPPPTIGEIIFRHTCQLGCEGIVSKQLGSRYVSGRTRDWLKAKNPKAPAVQREAEEDWST